MPIGPASQPGSGFVEAGASTVVRAPQTTTTAVVATSPARASHAGRRPGIPRPIGRRARRGAVPRPDSPTSSAAVIAPVLETLDETVLRPLATGRTGVRVRAPDPARDEVE